MFSQLDREPLAKVQSKLETELHLFHKIFVTPYADNTVILSETKEGMWKALDILQLYCELRQPSKCKGNDICKQKAGDVFDFKLNGETPEIVDKYIYLGVVSFVDTRNRLTEQAQKSLLSIYKLFRKSYKLICN